MPVDVADWLSGLGLGHYAPAFAANDIDGEVLRELTADDLIGLGVTSIGHRRKLLAAIAALRSEAPQPVAGTAPTPTASIEAERRQLTVMFCDLVGSTPLSARFDPEDLRELIGVYHRCVAETVARFAGFVAKYMGDGVLAYFGYPRAHEDDAERAVRAGLAVVEAVRRLQTPEALHTRIGLATGLAVVGDLIGSGAAEERAVIGEAPNLAARLQSLAGPNSVVVAQSTRRLVGDLFEYRELGAVDLKGFAAPVRAFEVVRARAVESRFEALHPARLTPVVGREEQIELLERRWQHAKQGEGRVVLITGEAGIGKSRIVAAIQGRLRS